MICRRCGAEIPDNSMRCGSCGIKVNMYCPACHTLNAFGEKRCVNCSSELLISCDVCGSTNMYYSTECRKCHSPLKRGAKPVEKPIKDVPVVESFSADESCYAAKDVSQPIKVTPDIEYNTLPTVEKVQTSYSSDDVADIFGKEEEFVHTEETVEPEIENEVKEDIQYNEDINIVEDNNSIELNESESIDEVIQIEEQQDALFEEDMQSVSDEIENIEDVQDIQENYEYSENEEEQVSDDVQIQEEPANKDVYKPHLADKFTYKDMPDISKIEIQKDAVEKISNIVRNSLHKHVIAINGEEGSGKSAVLKQVSEDLADKGYLSLYGSCTPLVQITSFGFFQDAFLRIMGFPPYAASTESFVKDFKKSHFAKVFSFLKGNDLNIFLNIFYPSIKDSFENILENKMKIFSILEKVIKSFLLNNNLIILIDNFELLDGASYDFIVHMMKNNFFNNRLKLIVAYQEDKDIKSYFELPSDTEKMFETVKITKFTKKELLSAVERNIFIKLQNLISDEEIDELVIKSDGNAVRMEQETAYLFDTGYIHIKDNEIIVDEQYKPQSNHKTFEELIKLRINSLPPSAKNVLFMAAIMGYRFATSILCISVTMSDDKAESVIDFLIKNLFIQPVDNYTCEFKSLTLWKLIYQEAKADLLYKENATRLYNSLRPLILSSNLQKLISCTEALSDNEEFLIWQNTAYISAKLGDTNLYIIALKQCLKLLDDQDVIDKDNTKQRIYEEMGKLLCEKSPQEAVTYLSNVLDIYIKEEDIRKIIDISSYFVKSCYLSGNYFGAAEAVDAVISAVKKGEETASPLEIALIKTRKLSALLNIGNSEEIINLTEEEIIPEIDRNIEENTFTSDYKNIVLNGWFSAKITLAKAYAIQGNNKANAVLSEIKEAIEQYDYNNIHYKLNVDIIEAFTKTVEGDINSSNEILNNISLAYKSKQMEQNSLAWWNLVSVINRVLLNQTKDLKVELFELAAFANNINEHFIKNIVKLILGYILKLEGNNDKAEEIYNEQIVYFSKEKVAIGALLAWALIVQKYIDEKEYDKALDTSNKALEIAQGPKINNNFFTIYFQKYIAEIYLKKCDFSSVKMYLEKSIMIAKQFNLRYQLVELYLSYALYVTDVMKQKKIYSSENVSIVHNMYKQAITIAKELSLKNLFENVNREYSGFKTFCQLNSIES